MVYTFEISRPFLTFRKGLDSPERRTGTILAGAGSPRMRSGGSRSNLEPDRTAGTRFDRPPTWWVRTGGWPQASHRQDRPERLRPSSARGSTPRANRRSSFGTRPASRTLLTDRVRLQRRDRPTTTSGRTVNACVVPCGEPRRLRPRLSVASVATGLTARDSRQDAEPSPDGATDGVVGRQGSEGGPFRDGADVHDIREEGC